MGIVECMSMEGYRMWYNSSDHLPPHFHCKKVSEWEIRVYFLDCSEEGGLAFDVKWGRDSGSRFRKELNKLVLQNRLRLLREWEEKVMFE